MQTSKHEIMTLSQNRMECDKIVEVCKNTVTG